MGDVNKEVEFARPVIKKNGRFANPESFDEKPMPYGRFLKFLLFDKRPKRPEYGKEKILGKHLPVQMRPELPSSEASSLSATWLGHATVLVRLEGVTFLTDPVFAPRVSPFSFMGPRRLRPNPLDIDELPKIDFAVISHDHYDHLDAKAVKALAERNPDMYWLLPMGMKALFQGWGVKGHIMELSWGESANLVFRGVSIEVWCVPAKHWGRRWLFDGCKRLWSGWAVVGPTRRFVFAGDTAYVPEEHGKIGKKLGPFDLAAIPIGCGEIKGLMSQHHICPNEAVELHRLFQAKTSIAIHWGTYELGVGEHYLQPRDRLKERHAEDPQLAESFLLVQHGEVWTVSE